MGSHGREGKCIMLTSGINQEKMSRLISDIEECCRKIDKTLQYISSVVEITEVTFRCDAGEQFRNHFRDLQTNYATIHDNILAYASDLNLVVQKYQRNSDINAADMRRASEELL